MGSPLVLLTLVSFLLPAPASAADLPEGTGSTADLPASAPAPDLVDRGRYLVRVAGCNDCHTPGWMESGGTVAESQWLTGDALGWRGPWGTTYPTNLRLLVQQLSESAWVNRAHLIKTRPPMPWWALNAMTDDDLIAIYRFVRHLGPKGEPAPAYVPPDQEPRTAYILMVPQTPE
jgi:mono/diheme cytochrome c family protein